MRRDLVKYMLFCLFCLGGVATGVSHADDEPFIGKILWVPYNFAPKGWAFCNGQILPISQYTALFSLLGTQYGGDGKSNFALPDMQGRVLLHAGQSPGTSVYSQGESAGETSHTLTATELPNHNHAVNVSTATGTATSPSGAYYAQPASGKQYGPDGSSSFASSAIVTAGGGQPHNNMMPYMTLNCIIALQGVFPPRP
ncbi:Microcystin-dependent protein [Trichlorobacter thiogenes]|uniref:Microcystin-dependent protein n=1 Tax=Trichlorobacter thiogenes TaxID=115783 RepID=A0A1T4QGS6_9BACT|nr:tail fiber protein [Trichlorobacter thiogenes]SKA02904.1 Microcystin-dependent protein [Trichlorobacter thiogenes]